MIGLDIAEKLTGADKLKLLVALLLVVAILAAAFGAGWAVNGWRLNAEYASILASKEHEIAELKSALQTQDAEVQRAGDAKKAADDRRTLARDMSKSVLAGIDAKAAKAAASTATDCEGVLREAHGDAQ